MTVSNLKGWIMIMIGVLKMIKADIDYIIEKLESYKPDNIYDGYNSEREKRDQRVAEMLDSIIEEIKSDYENMRTPMPKELVLTCKLDEEQMQRLKEQIESAKMSIEPVEESKWIKCSERLPEESDGTVLVCFPDEFPYSNKEPYVNAKHNQRVRTASYSQFNNTWYIGDFSAIGEVRPIAWMPLPEPPEVE